eukprot:TRINITY_DN24794_c0_g1_i1.p1 TRINITY_DN24794_c0_g1~~TRINITY_DN24794_c0_g1_i1.p1  ORF type:complete len:1085 (+),score=437.92 TRINITY_DN24794_c0_g1_i1:46-3300(+)
MATGAQPLPNPAEFEQILLTCGSVDNEARKLAEKAVVFFIKKKECVALLMAQLESSQHVQVRQLASILLAQKILSLWRKLDVTAKTQVKGALLARVLAEPVRVVRLGIAHCVAKLAKVEVSSGTWPELFQFLTANSQSTEAAHRELVIVLLHACCETIAGSLQEGQAGVITQFLVQGLSDRVEDIRVATLKAANAFLDSSANIPPVTIANLLPPMFQVLQASLASDNEDLFTVAFELLEDLLDTPSFEGKSDMLLAIVQFCLQSASNPASPLLIREKSAQILGRIAGLRPKMIIKHSLVEPMLRAAVTLLSDPTCLNSSLEPDEETLSHVSIGNGLIDALACALPSRAFGQPLLEWVRNNVVEAATQDPFQKKAAILALGAMSFGCRELLRDHIEFVVEVTKACVTDANGMVREAALVAGTQMTDYLQPEILDYHELLLPIGIESLGDASAHVREKAAYLVDNFAENLQEDVLPYAPALMEKLARIIGTDAGPDGMKARCVAAQAVSSIAEGLRAQFEPFAQATYQLLLPFLEREEDEMIQLRARAVDAIGVVMSSCGAGSIDQHLPKVMELVGRGLDLESHELTEYTFGFWANLAEVYPEKTAASLQVMVQPLLGCIDAKDGDYTSLNPLAGLPNVGPIGDDDDEESEEDDSSEGGDVRLRVDNKQNMAKGSALHCLGIFAKATGPAFEPFFEESMKRALDHSMSYDTTIRKNALELTVHLATWAWRMQNGDAPVAIGCPMSDTLNESAREVINMTIMAALQIIRSDTNKAVVDRACEGLGELASTVGAVAVHNHIDALMGELKNLLMCQTPCQERDDEDDDDEDLEEDHDEQLIDRVFEMIDKFATAYGPDWRGIFDEIFPLIEGYLAAGRPESDHYMAFATLGESCSAMGCKLLGLENKILDYCVSRGLKSKNPGVRSNACYTIGAVCEGAGQAGVPKYQVLLPMLGQVVTTPAKDGSDFAMRAVDNAVAAVCRMMKVSPGSCFMQHTLPAVLGHIPLKADFGENAGVYGTLLHLLTTAKNDVAFAVPQIAAVLAQGVAHEETQDELKPEMMAMLQQLCGEPAVRAELEKLPQEVRGVLGF